jgi:thiol-disulfide isomerase/thioredoxin
MNKLVFPTIAVGLLLMALSTVQAEDKPLSGNDPAPALSVAKWVKGEPVKLEDGKGKNIYVVEFWATWCPPCRESIPHLTQLQKKYKDANVVVVGVTDEDEETVAPFLKKMGDKMDYHVALDKDGETYKAFEAIAPIPGIPTAFVINKDGKVVWHGHPMDKLEDVLEQLTHDTAKKPGAAA